MKKFLIFLIIPVLFCGCASIGPQLKEFNDQVAIGVGISADVILAHWNIYSQGVKDIEGPGLDKLDNAKLKAAVTNLDELYNIRTSLTDEQKVDTIYWYALFIEAGGPKLIAAISKIVMEVSAYFK